jgi:DNA-binding GntR family transcriptional regulator
VSAATRARSGAGELLADRAYVELRDQIVTLAIPPGAPINEEQIGRDLAIGRTPLREAIKRLALENLVAVYPRRGTFATAIDITDLAIGRTPLREAIKRLALENLVAVYPRRGTFATAIDITDLAHVSDVRVQLEGHAAYRAAQRLTPAQREELEQLLAKLGRDGDAEALMRLDAEVHRFVYRCAGNPYLRETLERYLNLSLRIWYHVLGRLPHLPERVQEHVTLLEAVREGDADGARTIAAEHVAKFEDEIRGVL